MGSVTRKIKITFDYNLYKQGENPIGDEVMFYGWIDYDRIISPINYIKSNYNNLIDFSEIGNGNGKKTIFQYDVVLNYDYTVNSVCLTPDISIEDIKRVCLKHFGYVKPEYWKPGWRQYKKAKSEIYTYPLHIAFVVSWCLTKASLSSIGSHFGRNHATVINAVKKSAPSRIISNNREFISGLNKIGNVFGHSDLANNFINGEFKRK